MASKEISRNGIKRNLKEWHQNKSPFLEIYFGAIP
jgi:hypothetical protein